MPQTKKVEHSKRMLEARIAETERTIANSEQEIRANSSRLADTADQAAAEYERQALAHKAAVADKPFRISDKLSNGLPEEYLAVR